MTRYIDITRPIDTSLPLWPGRSLPFLVWEKQIKLGHHCSASSWELSAHTGTHMDAPLHFVDGGTAINEISPELFTGKCLVVDLRTEPQAKFNKGLAEECKGVKRLLLRTHHSDMNTVGEYRSHERQFTMPAADLLLSNGLCLVGTDRLTVDDSRGDDFSLHQLLLGAGCIILENLLLSEVQPGNYSLFAAPLLIPGAEASPIRAFLAET